MTKRRNRRTTDGGFDPLDALTVLSDNQAILESGPSTITLDLGDLNNEVALDCGDVQAERELNQEERPYFDAALKGLKRGDLRPLAAYLRSPFLLHPSIARYLADCIDEPTAFYRLTKYRSGPGARDDIEQTRLQLVRIGRFIEELNPRRGLLPRAMQTAAEKFDLSFHTIDQKWKQYLRYKRQGRVQEGHWVGKLGTNGARAIRSESATSA